MKNLFIAFIGVLTLTAWHDYHVTITEVNYSSLERTLVVAHKMFIDDLERALGEKGIKGIAMKLENEDEEGIKAVNDFIVEHFKVRINEKKIPLKFSGLEWEDHHALWLYFRADEVEEMNKIEIQNDLFVDLFESQENLHYVYFNEEKQDLLLNKDKTAGILFKGEK